MNFLQHGSAVDYGIWWRLGQRWVSVHSIFLALPVPCCFSPGQVFFMMEQINPIGASVMSRRLASWKIRLMPLNATPLFLKPTHSSSTAFFFCHFIVQFFCLCSYIDECKLPAFTFHWCPILFLLTSTRKKCSTTSPTGHCPKINIHFFSAPNIPSKVCVSMIHTKSHHFSLQIALPLKCTPSQ